MLHVTNNPLEYQLPQTYHTHTTQFVESMSRLWHYYEAFLGQTQLLNATPVRELANNFAGLKVRTVGGGGRPATILTDV